MANWRTGEKYFIVIAWMVVIFFMSNEVADTSSARSDEIVEAVQPYFSVLPVDDMTNFVRKLAHIVAYFILGMLLYNVVRAYDLMRYKVVGISMLITLGYAISDEIHQTYVPGRSGEVGDVLLDTLAATVGVACFYALQNYLGRHKTDEKAS